MLICPNRQVNSWQSPFSNSLLKPDQINPMERLGSISNISLKFQLPLNLQTLSKMEQDSNLFCSSQNEF